jgi:iron(II)-dependent oxidoreductase
VAAAVPAAAVATTPPDLALWVEDARRRTLELVEDLSDEQLMGPRLPTLNPLLWEIGHVAWFQESWVLRHAGGQPPIRGDADALYDSAAVPHDVRWDLPLPSRRDTLRYMADVEAAVLDRVVRGSLTPKEVYFLRLVVFHEDMHGEAFLYARQTLGYPAPALAGRRAPPPAAAAPARGDAEVAGGTFLLGADPGEPFVFDNEKWAHPVEVEPFRIARSAVTQAEFAAFVEDGGYRRRDLWTAEGWRAREAAKAEHPLHWRREGKTWRRRDFDRWVPLEPRRPALHVSAHEADAFCRWARRRLPTEAEWEAAASLAPGSGAKRRFPWGDAPPTPDHACLDGLSLGAADVDAFPAGDAACGCRQLLGNAWEWTATEFGPYPGFVADPYKEYSEPWFRGHRVLRGGCWATRSRLLRNTWRNFYVPDRRDVWAGFRTCALDR